MRVIIFTAIAVSHSYFYSIGVFPCTLMERATSRRAIKEQTVQTKRTVEEGQTVEETKTAKEPDTEKEKQTEIVKEVKEYTFSTPS